MSDRQVVVSGIRATGKMHLGNYLGVLERFARLSRDPEKKCYFFVADLHTLTTLKDGALIRQHAPNIILDMLAAGVDYSQAVIYAQSDVPTVAELAWFLACLTGVNELEGLPTFKDKAKKHATDVNGGLLFYPVLMAADILGPRAHFVPVGEDQRPHLELTRDIARKFNRLYGSFFPLPDAMEAEMVSVPGLVSADTDGNFAKMGKSEVAEKTLYLTDSSDEMREKILRAPTDPARARRTDPGTPENCAIFELHRIVSRPEDLAWSHEGCRTAAIACTECKDVLSNNILERLAAFRERRAELSAQTGLLEEILSEGAKQARVVFEETTEVVRHRMGVFYAKSRGNPA